MFFFRFVSSYYFKWSLLQCYTVCPCLMRVVCGEPCRLNFTNTTAISTKRKRVGTALTVILNETRCVWSVLRIMHRPDDGAGKNEWAKQKQQQQHQHNVEQQTHELFYHKSPEYRNKFASFCHVCFELVVWSVCLLFTQLDFVLLVFAVRSPFGGFYCQFVDIFFRSHCLEWFCKIVKDFNRNDIHQNIITNFRLSTLEINVCALAINVSTFECSRLHILRCCLRFQRLKLFWNRQILFAFGIMIKIKLPKCKINGLREFYNVRKSI